MREDMLTLGVPENEWRIVEGSAAAQRHLPRWPGPQPPSTLSYNNLLSSIATIKLLIVI